MESEELRYARVRKGLDGIARFRALHDADVFCWDRDGTSWVLFGKLSALQPLFNLPGLHPEGEVDGMAVSGSFIFELTRAEHETDVTVWEMPSYDGQTDPTE